MLSLTIKDTKAFMSHLLIKETFDCMLLSEAAISTANTYIINGSVNTDFFDEDELASLDNRKYSYWSSLKPFCFSLIKGNKVPVSMKIIFLLSDNEAFRLFSDNISDYSFSDVNGLFLNLKYSNGSVTLVTGTSLKIFTMDKTLETAFDKYIKLFLEQNGISYEEF